MSEEVNEEEVQTETAPAVESNDEAERLRAELATAKAALKAAKEAEKAVRGNSDKLLTEKKAADAKLKALGDYDKVVEILGAVKTVEEANAIESGDVEKVYETRHNKFLEDIHTPIVTENENLKTQVAELTLKVSDHEKRPKIEAGWKAAKGKADKLKYHYAEAARVFNLEDGAFVPRDESGNIIYGSGGADPITVEQFFNGLLLDEPDHKIPSTGTTATGGGSGKTTVTVNPWSKTYQGGDKYTLRAQIKKEAPAKAAQLMREAGYTSRR